MNLHENVLAVKIDGPTKEDFVWGFRLGFISFGCRNMTEEQYDALLKKLTGALRATISSSSRPAQSLLIQVLKNPGYAEEKEKLFMLLKERYKKVKQILASRNSGKALKELPFNSGYFMSFETKGLSAEKLRKELLYSKGIGTISIMDKYLRIAFSSVDTDKLEALYNTIFETADELIKQ
jgi:aspartate/methionine/tyrosine aminotransferase